MEKTILEWYKTLPEPIRTMAIENYDENYAPKNYEKSEKKDSHAIGLGFDWGKSSQRHDFWQFVQFLLLRGEIGKHPLVIEWNEKNGKSNNKFNEAWKLVNEHFKSLGDENPFIKEFINSLGEPVEGNTYVLKPLEGRWWIEHKEVGSGEPLEQMIREILTRIKK